MQSRVTDYECTKLVILMFLPHNLDKINPALCSSLILITSMNVIMLLSLIRFLDSLKNRNANPIFSCIIMIQNNIDGWRENAFQKTNRMMRFLHVPHVLIKCIQQGENSITVIDTLIFSSTMKSITYYVFPYLQNMHFILPNSKNQY